MKNFQIQVIRRQGHFLKINLMRTVTTQKIRVGIFVVVGTIILVVALYFIGSRQHIFSRNIALYAVFDNVSGLQIGNNVRYSGINLGTVTKIEMKEVGEILVEMSIAEKSAHFIKKNAIASINSDGLVGSMVVNIIPGNQQQPAVVSGDTIQTEQSVSTNDMLKTLGKTNDNVALLSQNLLEITNEILEGKGTLGMLINDTVLSQNIQQVVVELRKTSEGADLAISEINQIISRINYDESAAAVILSDTAAANQIRTVFENIEKSSEDVNAITQNLDAYIKEVKSGKGALNYLTQDEAFVKEVDTTMIQIKEASERLNETLEALKHSFLLRGSFRRLERREAKEAENK